MKKAFLLITVCLICLTILFSLCACPSNNTNEGGNTSNNTSKPVVNPKPEPKPDPVTAYSKLTSDEKSFFDFFSKRISSFKSPESVRAQLVESYDSKAMFGVKVSAANGFGASTTETYFFYTSGQVFKLKKKYVPAGMLVMSNYIQDIANAAEYLGFMEMVNDKKDDIEYSVKRINDALKEYKIEQGWIDE